MTRLRRPPGLIALSALALLAAPIPSAAAAAPSLPAREGLGPRPGPAILYRAPAVAPQLTNRAPWRASPILVSGAEAYRQGEFLYQDYLDDDHGAKLTPDPNDPASQGNTFSKPNGTLTYPTAPAYAGNAADLVEFRVKPLASSTIVRITLNTLKDPRLIAFTIALGGTPGRITAFPFGANVRAPAALFLTVHPQGNRLVAVLQKAAGFTTVKGPAPTVSLDMRRRQITVSVTHRTWNPRASTVRMAMGVGLWSAATGRYLLPGSTASATQPGGAGTAAAPAAFFNVAFRTREPLPSPTAGLAVLLDPSWWRDNAQGNALAAGDISSLYANVSFAKLRRRLTDNSGVPRTGPMDRILASHYETAQGEDFSGACALQGASKPASCRPELLQRLQPYAIYIPSKRPPAGGYGLTLLLHSLSANYNQYLATRNQLEFGNRTAASIVITPEARGPDLFYEGMGAVDTFEVWNDVAHRFHLNPAYTDITGYSMGGFGTFKLGAQFPDLFARAQPTVGEEVNQDVLASFRNLPLLMWNNSADELVPPPEYLPDANTLNSLGLRFELDVYQPCPSTQGAAMCSPLFPNHLELAVNDQYAPAAAFLGGFTLTRDPAHVTYVLDAARDRPKLGVSADHVYWVSGLKLRSASHTSSSGDPEGEIDVVSHGFGTGEPPAAPESLGTGTLNGGNLGPITYAGMSRTWGAAPPAPRTDTLSVSATNIATAAIDVKRARVDCAVKVAIASDGPLAIRLLGCGRTVQGG